MLNIHCSKHENLSCNPHCMVCIVINTSGMGSQYKLTPGQEKRAIYIVPLERCPVRDLPL